jgi:hypothetical protein
LGWSTIGQHSFSCISCCYLLFKGQFFIHVSP